MDDETQQKLFFAADFAKPANGSDLYGKSHQPVSKKVEKKMNYVKVSIDTLGMLQDKTKGNLSKTEEQYLSGMITRLKIDCANTPGGDENSDEEQKNENQNED